MHNKARHLLAASIAALALTQSIASAVSIGWTYFPSGPVYEGQTIAVGANVQAATGDYRDYISSQSWQFYGGNGQAANGSTGQFTYLDNGTYYLSFNVSGEVVDYYEYLASYIHYHAFGSPHTHYETRTAVRTYGFSTGDTRLLTVLNLDPTITGYMGVSEVGVGETFNFSATATDPGMDSLTYSWSLGGTTLLGSSQSFTFTDPGLYSIDLTVLDDDGGRATKSYSVNVTAAEAVPEDGKTVVLLGIGCVALGAVPGLRRARILNT